VGEGIRYVIRAGRRAGGLAAQAAAAGDSSAEFLAQYDRAWWRRYGREMAVAYWVHRRLARYGDRNWRVVTALMACLSPAQAAAGLHGDFTLGWWLKLAAVSPRLIGSAARALR
jgi:flavin-dependent dehydrogenase